VPKALIKHGAGHSRDCGCGRDQGLPGGAFAAPHEHERTREWLENRGLPKAARVAQYEAYNVLRRYGVISETARSSRAPADVGRNDYTPPEPHLLSHDEIAELAEACVAMLETLLPSGLSATCRLPQPMHLAMISMIASTRMLTSITRCYPIWGLRCASH
jgi:hypothetical protein